MCLSYQNQQTVKTMKQHWKNRIWEKQVILLYFSPKGNDHEVQIVKVYPVTMRTQGEGCKTSEHFD